MKYMTVLLSYLGLTASSTTKSERCQKLVDFTSKSLAEINNMSNDHWIGTVQFSWIFSIDPRNITARDDALCSFADAKNLSDYYEVTSFHGGYERFAEKYKMLQKFLESSGGYTSFKRRVQIKQDLQSLKEKVYPLETVKDRFSLEKFTHFFKGMRVKFGSRWPTYLLLHSTIYDEDDDLVLSREFYEGRTFINGEKSFHMLLGDIYADGLVLLGDMGLLNLET